VSTARIGDALTVPSDGISYSLRRHHLGDGERTTIYIVRHPLERSRPRVQLFRQARRLDHWCSKQGHKEAIVAGFYLRDPFRPLGEVMAGGRATAFEPFAAPYGPRRAALHATDGRIRIAPRHALGEVGEGDLVQAGPMLISDGRVLFDRETDHEGFSAGAGQFDSDITDGRHPRAAIGISDRDLYLVCCDGRRSGVDAGLTLEELSHFMLVLGCRDAMNLDGGGSTTLIHRGHLLNRPYSEHDQPAPASRPIVSAIIVERR
jgi:Phosphodiester glycosidase